MDDAEGLSIARKAVLAGGKAAFERLDDPGFHTWKRLRDPVPEGVLAVQEAVVDAIRRERPDDGILAEEGPEDEAVPVDAENLWIVDPVCGSINFAQGIPLFAVSVALRTRGNIRAGAVFDPCRNELFEATFEGSARMNGDVIQVQQIAEGMEVFEKSWLAADLAPEGDLRADSLDVFRVMAEQVTGVSMINSPALAICWVAMGRLHAYWTLEARIWDVAAASLILKRAGGTFTDAEGASWLHSTGGYIASNAIIHGWTLRCIQRVRESPTRTAVDR
ncbi:MAG TPA: inositol monophosphatase family protein [Chloroflexota bacterium]|nr:inositol monophosphatase family protein [Chloroflexota bacterium]